MAIAKLNGRQLTVLLCGIVIVVAMRLYPPWHRIGPVLQGPMLVSEVVRITDAGYAPVLAPGLRSGEGGQWGNSWIASMSNFLRGDGYHVAVFGGPNVYYRINARRLAGQAVVVILLTLVGALWFGAPRPPIAPTSPEPGDSAKGIGHV